jgi:hypothetical protein
MMLLLGLEAAETAEEIIYPSTHTHMHKRSKSNPLLFILQMETSCAVRGQTTSQPASLCPAQQTPASFMLRHLQIPCTHTCCMLKFAHSSSKAAVPTSTRQGDQHSCQQSAERGPASPTPHCCAPHTCRTASSCGRARCAEHTQPRDVGSD